jgi:hypothetical protein
MGKGQLEAGQAVPRVGSCWQTEGRPYEMQKTDRSGLVPRCASRAFGALNVEHDLQKTAGVEQQVAR